MEVNDNRHHQNLCWAIFEFLGTNFVKLVQLSYADLKQKNSFLESGSWLIEFLAKFPIGTCPQLKFQFLVVKYLLPDAVTYSQTH